MMTRRRSTPSCAKIACCVSPDAAGRPGVRRDRHARRLLRASGRPQDVLDDRRHAGGVGGALDDGGLHAALADPLRDVADEQLGHVVDAVHVEIALRHPPHARRDDHVHARAPGHVEDQADVPAEIDGGEVDDRADAAAVEIRHLPLGDLQDLGAIPEMRPVLLHPGRPRHDVLVHQGWAELRRRDRTERCLHRRCHVHLQRAGGSQPAAAVSSVSTDRMGSPLSATEGRPSTPTGTSPRRVIR